MSVLIILIVVVYFWNRSWERSEALEVQREERQRSDRLTEDAGME